MNLRICLLLFSISTVCFSQIKKQEHKELRSKKEIEQETVLQKITENVKNNYHFSKTNFYRIDTELTINSKLFYAFQGISKLQTITPLDCESKYSLDKERFEANKESEDKILKGERNPRNNKPFYLTSVFEQLGNIFENYKFFSKTDYTFNSFKSFFI